MKRTLTAMVGIGLVATAASARIGESISQCDARYGNHIDSSFENAAKTTGTIDYLKNDLHITIHFRDGFSDMIRYAPGKLTKVDLETAEYLINLNGRDKKWDRLTATEEKIYHDNDPQRYPEIKKIDPVVWQTKDGLIHADYSPGKGTLEIKAKSVKSSVVEGL